MSFRGMKGAWHGLSRDTKPASARAARKRRTGAPLGSISPGLASRAPHHPAAGWAAWVTKSAAGCPERR